MMCTDVLILAGGSGERLWPESSQTRPKQFMALPGGETFLQSAIRRAFQLGIEGDICVVTRKDWTGLVIQDVCELSDRMNAPLLRSKVLVMSEPCGKNTAPAIAWTARCLLASGRNRPVNILMMASDHIITDDTAFARDAATAAWHADRNRLVTFAIPPVDAATGYGYIEAGPALKCDLAGAGDSFKVAAFREKPDAATAEAYLNRGSYYWNSGLYAFRADFFLSELKTHSPAVNEAFASVAGKTVIEDRLGVRVMTSCEGLEAAYRDTPSISIDYAISEKCTATVAVLASFGWDDVGTWDSLAKYFPALGEQDVSVASSNCFVHADLPVALCGVEDVVVVVKNGRVLVCKKGETNLVKDALALMKNKGLA
jgi:mannose-1-phosphate guanylyltransferase/mannose-6-phosphate isomerase